MISPTAALLKLNVRLAAREVISGGIPEYTPADIAAALAGLDRMPYLLGLAAINHQQEVVPELERLLWQELAGVAATNRWLISVGIPRTRYLAQMALYEAINPPRCRACKGKGHVYPPNSAVVECVACEGTGNGVISVYVRAKWMKVRKETWNNVWRDRYERHAVWRIREYEAQIIRHLRQKLGS